ncbi:MAG: serine/threonine protein kinase [Myxococcales bacterium]|nr:serine/threonine protein kinase [Myxococcales bacterium]MDH3483884.1 serine/threonine protein kinase [Myxococcales bacterium]
MDSIAPDGHVVCSACGGSNPLESRYCGKCGGALDRGLPKPGDVIAGRYRVVAPIGRGAMGMVYRAEHVQISKVVAIKLLHRELQENPENVSRFHLEAESASRLNHPNTVHVFDFGRTESGALYIVMEYVDGADLGKLIGKEGPIPFGRVAYLCAQVAGSVADAHEEGIIHRDLKPENIVVTEGRDGEMAKVLDFGLAKLFEGTAETQVTSSGTIVGTPYYMSPEQIQGHELDGRSDVYAMGAIMYECVVGKPPFEAANPVGVLSQHLSQQPLLPSLRSPLSVPTEADDIIMRCLEKDLERRYESAEALRRALIGYLSTVGDEDWRTSRLGMRATGSGTRRVDSLFEAKQRGWWVFALLSILLLGIGGWHYLTRGPSEHEPNHTEENANRLPERTEMGAYLGQRLDENSGDVDLFAIEHTGAEARAAIVEVSAIPNMNLTLEILKAGQQEPELFTDTEGLGEGERLPNVPLEPGTYFIRVREKVSGQRLPTENVSDEYYVRWELRDKDPDFEREPNDSLELAEPLPFRDDRRAWIGWPGDVDTFCLSEDADAVVAQVSALAGVDLVLRIVDRRTDRSGKHDSNGVGRGETTKTWRNAKAGMLCVEVSAHPQDDRGAAAQPDETYGVRFIKAPGR